MIEKKLDELNRKEKLIACGGINSRERLKERTLDKRVEGVQIFTPLIFNGPGLLRELKAR